MTEHGERSPPRGADPAERGGGGHTTTVPTRTRILEAARALFLAEGEGAVTMRAVAGRAGVSAMAAYRHYPNREALLGAVMESGHDRFLAYLQRALAATGPLERLAATGQAYLDFALANPRDYELMFLRPAEGPPSAGAPAWRDAATFRFLVDRVAECMSAGHLDPGEPERAALSIWAHAHGLVSLYLAHKLAVDEAGFRTLYAQVTGAPGPRETPRPALA